VGEDAGLPLRELELYVQRVSDRWAIERAVVGGSAAVDRSAEESTGDPSFVIVLVSAQFDGVPWLERIRQAKALWDAHAAEAAAEVHCYTPVELDRKRAQVPQIRHVLSAGVDLLAAADAAPGRGTAQ
jgi:ABC-type sugar transport system substrate-binding protein